MTWIRVEDRVPPLSEWVLLFCADTDDVKWGDPVIFVGRRDKWDEDDIYESAYSDEHVPCRIKIISWMPLPKPPENNDLSN